MILLGVAASIATLWKVGKLQKVEPSPVGVLLINIVLSCLLFLLGIKYLSTRKLSFSVEKNNKF